MNISPELLETLQQKSDACSYSGNSWRGYAVIVRYIREALQRIPSSETVNTGTEDAIDRIFEAELEYLARAVAEIFPVRGLEEFVYYLDTPR